MHTTRSADGQHRAALHFEGEIRFGPEYFRLSVDGREVPHRIFGKPLCWSPDSRVVVAQEWLTTNYGEGPVTCAALVDVQAWAIARLEVAVKGFAEDFRFDAHVLRLSLALSFHGRGVRRGDGNGCGACVDGHRCAAPTASAASLSPL